MGVRKGASFLPGESASAGKGVLWSGVQGCSELTGSGGALVGLVPAWAPLGGLSRTELWVSPPTARSAALERGPSAFAFPARKQRLREGKPSAWSHTALEWWSSWALGPLSGSQPGELSSDHTHTCKHPFTTLRICLFLVDLKDLDNSSFMRFSQV